MPVDYQIGRALGEVAPSLLLTAMSESAAFLLGAISSMPAVRSFSLYAGVAVFFNFVLQVCTTLSLSLCVLLLLICFTLNIVHINVLDEWKYHHNKCLHHTHTPTHGQTHNYGIAEKRLSLGIRSLSSPRSGRGSM